MLEHLATLREQIAKCEQLRDRAKSSIKRHFERIMAHCKVLAGELEAAIDQERMTRRRVQR
ncbi:hypothetical protein XH88_25995 [Bradyrhizobium sp. CCBAU 51627]|nr:hypothetical protein [Bradyrhizobium sp. CCBAU 51627]